MDLKQWLLMGGYAFYVWLAYGCVFALLVIYPITVACYGRRVRKAIRRFLQRLSA